MFKTLLFILTIAVTGLAKSQDVAALVQKGLYYDSLNQYNLAITQYLKAAEIEPQNGVIHYNLGVSRMNLGQLDLAIVDFNKAIFLDTNISDAYYNRYLAYRYQKQYQFALADLEHFMGLLPVEFDLDLMEEHASLCVEMKEFATAKKDYETLWATQPERADFALSLFNICMASADYAKAEKVMFQLRQIYPDSNQFLYYHALSNYYFGKHEESLRQVQLYLLEDAKNVDALKLKADNYFYLNQFSDASNIYEQLLIKDSNNCNLLADLGHCMLQVGEFEKADSILTKSIRAKNESPAYAYLGRGIARYNLGRGDEACLDWSKSKQLGESGAETYLMQHCKHETTTK